ncbi:hypothetical protein RA086_04710 [Lactiplantibacillus sp. WILCCON 0030]|uniref:Preprotein translocase subunit SecB n=1 Tax=Lactiplantibacillus brownii TaxID=3069269 RepID=A0ABU1A7U7_9LACO|nr:hypothetical protein [Lactiplantibacillus brownii]MDQ7936943.1 hypothetical protein [Lactiplantibacillus brownii]
MNIEILNSAIQDLHFQIIYDRDESKDEPGKGQFSYTPANDDVKKTFGDDVVQAQLEVTYKEDMYDLSATVFAIVRLSGELVGIIERQSNDKKIEDDEQAMLDNLNNAIIPALSAKARAYAALLSTEASNFAIMPADFDNQQANSTDAE